MNPFLRNKIDLSTLNLQEKQLLEKKYGIVPRKNILTKMQKERKYFDSGDYALSKAGVAPPTIVGTAIPNPENIPHASSAGNGHGVGHQSSSISPTNSTSPVSKESSLSHSEIRGDEERVQESEPPGDDVPAEPADVQTVVDEKSEAL